MFCLVQLTQKGERKSLINSFVREIDTLLLVWNNKIGLGWVGLVGFNVGLEQLLPTVWDSFLRMIRRHAITILIRHLEDGSPRGTIWMGTLRTLHPRQILHAPGAINVHGNVQTNVHIFNEDTLP